MQPKISVCVPTYNGGKYLRECLDDILAQTFGDFEVLIVDDASTDDTLDIVQRYAANDKRIRVQRNSENIGLVANWNRCLDLAQGDWIKFVFQDDRVVPACLEILLERSQADVPFTVCQRSFLYENVAAEARASYERFLKEQSLAAVFPEAGLVAPFHFCRAALARPGINFVGEPTAVMLHRSARERFGGFNHNFVQLCDFEYWARIACNVGLVVVPEILASFRIHPESKTAANNEKREFRTEVIDPLMLKYEFAYGACFGPMRTVAKQLGVNLQKSLATQAKRVELQVRRRAKDILLPDAESLTEWESVIAAFPRLAKTPHAVLNRVNRTLDRHFLWRFRNPAVRFKNPDIRCPIVVCMDVEPDDSSITCDQPVSWKGFEIAAELFSTLRPLLAAATGAAIHYTWMLARDECQLDVSGSSHSLLRQYDSQIRNYMLEGDELGIVEVCPIGKGGATVQDDGKDCLTEDRLEKSFAAFCALLGKKCELFRVADGWLSNKLVQELERLNTRFDFSLQAGKRRGYDCDPLRHSSRLPLMPYRPATEDFMTADASRTEGLWIIPLSAGMESYDPPSEAASRPHPFNLESPPEEFEWLVNKIVCEMDRPYLALTMSSSIGIKPKLLRNVKMNFSTLLMHPLADRLVFSTPREALGILGYGD